MTVAPEDAIAGWRADPCKFAWDQFEFTPDRWQARALMEFPDPLKQRLALQACVGPGKTVVEAIAGWNFLGCYARGHDHPNAVAMSVSGDNLKANLWKELAVWRERSPYFSTAFEMNNDRIFEREHAKTWFLEARTWPQKSDVEAQGRTLSGLHAKFILYLIDECGDIHPAVLRAAEQGLSNCEWGKIVVAGNPTSHSGMLYFVVKTQPHLWTIIRVTGDPDDPDRSPRINLEWAKTQIGEYGRTNPWVMYAILGLFPPVSVNALLGPDEVAAAMQRHLREDAYEFSQKRIGVDVARFGDDATILCPRQGLWVADMVEMRNADGPTVASRLILGKQKWGSELELIDSTGGHASSVIDFCRQAGVNLFEVNFAGHADDRRYFNKRSEMAFRCAEWVKGGGALPTDAQLARELVAPTYWFEKGQFRVVEKDQIKKELQGHSPDRCDALWTTFALADMPTQAYQGTGGEAGAHAATEWDPHR